MNDFVGNILQNKF